MEYEDCPSQDDHFNGLEEEIHSDEANSFDHCRQCDELIHITNLHNGMCEDCWDEQIDEPYEDDVWADSDALSSAGWGMDEDYE